MTNSVSGGQVLETVAALALAGTVLCWRDALFLTFLPVCMPLGEGPEVLADLFQDGLYRIIISQGHKE